MKRWYGRGLFLAFLILIGVAGTLSRQVPLADERNLLLAPLARIFSLQGRFALRYARPAVPLLPAGLAVAGLPVGGLTLDEAMAWLEQHRLAPLRQALRLHIGQQTLQLDPASVGLQVDTAPARQRLDKLIGDWPPRRWTIYLGSGLEWTAPFSENVPLPVSVDETALRSILERLDLDHSQEPLPMQTLMLSDTAPIAAAGVDPFWTAGQPVAAFVAPTPGFRLDAVGALPEIAAALQQWQREPVTLTLEPVPPPEPDIALLETVLRKQLERMPAVIGIYVQELPAGRTLQIHAGTVFSAASVMKIAILLQAYRMLEGPPTKAVVQDLEWMMINSDNAAANRLMAFGGAGNATQGLQHMTEMLRQLGLTDSFMCNTYDGGPRWRGCPPAPRPVEEGDLQTDVDEVLQTTPRDMGRLLVYLYECSAGRGPLLEEFPEEITAGECQSMIALMKRNADVTRMVAGLPAIPVAHKSGWIDDMKADAGIVYSRGASYVLSVFIWQEGVLSEWESSRWLARLSWIVYSFFNPL
jgi:hypothetical protein